MEHLGTIERIPNIAGQFNIRLHLPAHASGLPSSSKLSLRVPPGLPCGCCSASWVTARGIPHQKSGPVKELRAFPITAILRTPYSPFKPPLSLKEQIQLGQCNCNKIPCSLTDDMVGSVQGSFSFSVHPWTCFSQVLWVLSLCPAGEEDLSLVARRVLFTHPSGTWRSGWQHTVCQSFPACCVLKALFFGCQSAVSSCYRSLSVQKRSLAQSFAQASVSSFLLWVLWGTAPA